jgi:hypothetical protein
MSGATSADYQGDDFGSAFEQARLRLWTRVNAACASQLEWPLRIAAAIRATFEFVAEWPEDARLLTVDALAAGEADRFERMLSDFAGLLARDRELSPGSAELPPIHEDAAVGGMALLVLRHLDRGLEDEVPALAPGAIEFVLAPYLGARKARCVAGRTE